MENENNRTTSETRKYHRQKISDRLVEIINEDLKADFIDGKFNAEQEGALLIYSASSKYTKEHTGKFIVCLDDLGIIEWEGLIYQIIEPKSKIEIINSNHKLALKDFLVDGQEPEIRKYSEFYSTE